MSQNKSKMYSLHPDTVTEMRAMVTGHGSYRKAAHALGISHALVWNIVNQRAQDVGYKTENRVRAILGLPSLAPLVSVPACEDCGGVHTGNCKGRAVKVVPVSHRAYKRISDIPVSTLAMMVRERELA